MITRILAIVPYAALKEVIMEAIKEREDVVVDIYEGDLEAGIEVLYDVDLQRYDVILSRGGTAEFLRKHIKKPVIDIGITAFDIIRLVKTLENFRGKAAIVAFKKIANQAKAVGNLVGTGMNIYVIKNHQEAEERLKCLKKEGFDLVIGDVVTTNIAKKIGLNGILIASGKESVLDGLDRAVEANINSGLAENTRIINAAILESVGKYVCAINASGSAYFNTIPDRSLIEQIKIKVQELDKELLDDANCIIQDNNRDWSLSCKRISLNSEACYICTVHKIQDENNKNGIRYFHSVLGPFSPYGIHFAKMGTSTKLRNQITSYASTDFSTLIVGETGVGKKAIGYAIYEESAFKNAPFIEVDCAAVNEEGMEAAMRVNKGTVMFTNLECLTEEKQKYLYKLLKKPGIHSKIRLIAEANSKIFAMQEEGKFHKKLLMLLRELEINVPPLRERKEELEGMAGIILYELSSEYRCSAVGLTAEAKESIVKYDWPGNIDQLYRVIRNADLCSKDMYISGDEINSALKDEEHLLSKNTISIEGTFDDISKRIFMAVLQEEDMNQSKTAQRLGISRSTLWRKISE